MEKDLNTKHKQATLINYLKTRIGWELWRVRADDDTAINSLTILAPTEVAALKIAENYYRKLYG